jgi:hypothetical protein
MTNDPTSNYIDLGAVTLWIATAANLMPAVAAMLSIIWFTLRIVETRTVQKLLGSYAWIDRSDKHDGSED